ncbi:MAG: GNAT family N-acetyltransferase [Parcubacteria group bacterium]|nr:GNAT family N-acetyltransferase [Parcubacteria group bacterium]
MKKQYNFRKAGVGDLDSFFVLFDKLTLDLFPDYSLKIRKHILKAECSHSSIKAQFKAKQIIIYLAFDTKDIIGYLIVRPIVGGVCMGDWMAVNPNHQGKGVASGLLSVWEKDAKINGMHKLHLWTHERNVIFYRNRGFDLVGMVPENYYGTDDYFFHKTIQKPIEKNFLK